MLTLQGINNYMYMYAKVSKCTCTCTQRFHEFLLSSCSLSLSYRIVYRWFLWIYQASYILGILGYIILLVVFTGLGLLLPFTPDTILEVGITFVFYGVYYGVLGRDCAEVCVDYMAAAMTVREL